MPYNTEYAVRIAKLKFSTRKKPDCLYITFGPKAHVKKYNAVEISIFPNKISFRFFITEVKKFGPKSGTAHSKKVRITNINSSISRVAIYDEDFIKKLEGFKGEYHDININPMCNPMSTDNYVWWINLCNKESYTNMYNNTSTEYSHNKPKITNDVIKRIIDKQYEEIEAKTDEELVEELINKEESGTIIPPGEELKIEDILLKPTTNYPETIREYAIQVLIERYTNSVKHKPERDLVRMLIEGRY